MKAIQTKAGSKGIAALLALLGAFASPCRAASQPRFEAAWQEALALAGAAEATVLRPEIVFAAAGSGRPGHVVAEYVPFANEVHLYRSDRVPAHFLLVHEFLHAIYHQTRSESISLADLAQADPSEDWVRDLLERRDTL